MEFARAHHAKHVFRSPAPAPHVIAASLHTWLQKRRWQYHLSSHRCSLEFQKLSKTSRTPYCPHQAPAAMENEWHRIRFDLMEEYTARFLSDRAAKAKQPAVITLGMDLAAACPYRVARSDKDRCLVLTPKASIDACLQCRMPQSTCSRTRLDHD